MNVKRVIRVFNISNDELVDEIELNKKDSERIKKMFKAHKMDDNYYGLYEIGIIEFITIVNFLPEINKYNLNSFELYFTSLAIY